MAMGRAAGAPAGIGNAYPPISSHRSGGGTPDSLLLFSQFLKSHT